MPHIVIEYTANVEVDARITELMRVLGSVLIRHPDIFPPGGIRTRAIRLDRYRMADGAEDGAFIHVAFRIKAGRPKAVTGPICAELFAALRAHMADAFSRRYLGLTLELTEFDTHGFYVENNMHSRFAASELRDPHPTDIRRARYRKDVAQTDADHIGPQSDLDRAAIVKSDGLRRRERNRGDRAR